MPSYVRRSGDKKFRKVSIQSEVIPQYQDFSAPGESVSYTDFQVLEVLRENGTTELYHEGGVETANYAYSGMNGFLIGKNIPLARIWARRSDGLGIPYKVPCELPVKGNSVEFRISGSVQGMELFGDKYFEMVYKLQK